MNAFQLVDLFGKKIELNFNGTSRAKTHVGGIFSVIFFGFVIWSTYHVSGDLFSHANPKTISSEFFSENPDSMTLSPETFTLGFGLQTPDTFEHYIDESIYTIEVRRTQVKRTTNSDGSVDTQWTTTNLQTERCTTSHFGELGPKFGDIGLDQLFCFAPTQPSEDALRIQGVFESPVYEYITVFFKECDEATSSVPCADGETRRRLLQGGFFATYFPNMAFDPKDYDDPAFRYRDSTFTTFGNNYYKEVTAWLSHVKVTSDSGWITEESETKEYVKFDNMKELFTLRSDMGSFLDFVIRVNKITTKHERSYIKVQDILAEVNGLMGTAILVIYIIVAPYCDLKFYEGLINELFDVKMQKDKKDQKGKPKNKKVLRREMSLTNYISDYLNPSRTLSSPTRKLGMKKNKSNEMKDNAKSPLKLNPEERCVEIEQSEKQSASKLKAGAQKRAIFSKTSVVDDASIYSMQIDEDNNRGKVHYESHSAKLARSPLSNLFYNSNIHSNKENEKNQEASSQQNHLKVKTQNLRKRSSLLKKAHDDYNTNKETKLELPSMKLQQDIPQAVKPKIKILENPENMRNSIDVILESFIIDQEDMPPIQEPQKKNALPKCVSSELGLNQDESKGQKTFNENKESEHNKAKENDENKDDKVIAQNLLGLALPISAQTIKVPTKLDLTFWEYIRSYIWKSDEIREKLHVLNEGRRRIDERLDIFGVFKKLREVDKLKLLLLENEQLVLFDGLSKPELKSKNCHGLTRAKTLSQHLLKEARFINERRKSHLVSLAYDNLKKKSASSLIDQKLLDIYDYDLGKKQDQ